MLLLRNSTSFGLANTSSFRRASKKLFSRWGSNLQNPSKRALKIYRAPKGRKFIQADQAGAEALIVAYLCPLGRFRKLFLNGIKPHTYVASNLFTSIWLSEGYTIAKDILKYEPAELKQQPEWQRLATHIQKDCDSDTRHEYFIGKKSCHSYNYRMRPPTFREDVLKESEGEVSLSKDDAELSYGTYHKLFEEISLVWWPEIEFNVKKTHYLYNLFGFPRYCQGPYDEKTWRELTAFIPQSTVACITANAFCDMQDYIEDKGRDWNILNDKHDSILCDAPDSEAEECGRILNGFLACPLTSPRGEEFRMRSEVAIGDNWGKYDEKSNPDGMREIKL